MNCKCFADGDQGGKTLSGGILWMFLALAIDPGAGNGAALPDASWSSENSRLGLLQRSTLLIGKKIADRNEHAIGKLEDIVVDVPHARVLFTLVSTGGGDQLAVIPAQCYAYLSRPKLFLNVDRKVLRGAPQVSRANPLQALDPSIIRGVYAHFSIKEPECAPTQLSSGSGLVGAALLSRQNELLGHVKDIMVDVPLGRAVFLVVEPIGSGHENRLYVVPPAVAHRDGSGATLQLNCSQADFVAGPYFQSEFWTDLAFPEMATRVRQHYHLPESGAPAVVASAPEPPPTNPGKDSTSRSDEAITKAILAELVRDTSGFLSVNVTVNTVNGKVRVGGKVRSEKQKKLIITAAERVAGPGNVEDHFETGNKSRTAEL